MKFITGFFTYLFFAFDRIIMAFTFRRLPSFSEWLDKDYAFTDLRMMQASFLRVVTGFVLVVFHYFAAWWLIVGVWGVVAVYVGVKMLRK
jgi:hypothetical protein